jgi:hypothetical protein
MSDVKANESLALRPLIQRRNHMPSVSGLSPAVAAGWAGVYAAAHAMAQETLRRQWTARYQPGVN